MQRATDRRAIIVGGSMSGLLMGLMLQRAGWAVDIFERVDTELSGRGAGIVAQREVIARLQALGLVTDDLGVQVAARKILDVDGRVTDEIECRQTLTAWERLYRLLRDAFAQGAYHRGRAVIGVTQHADHVTAHFADGENGDADILIGADGIRSSIRAQVLPQVAPLYAGYVAWRALIAEQEFPPDIHRDLFAVMAFGLPPGEQFLGYPVAGPDNDLRAGHRRYNVVWYRPADAGGKLAWLLTDDTGKTHDISIPPPLIRDEAIAAMRADAERLLAPQFRQIVRMMQEPILQPIYDLETPRMALGRVALIGDAAFVARPHVAAGVSKAADDAAALAAALAGEDDVVAALQRFEAVRLPENSRIIERARHLGAYLQSTRTEAEQARAGRHSTTSAVLRETALIDFLYA